MDQRSEYQSPIERVSVRVLPDGRVPRKEAAAYIGNKPTTLAQWALRGYGPRPVRVGGRIFYFLKDLDSFISGEAA